MCCHVDKPKMFLSDWEAPEIQDNIKHTIDFLTKGCGCKKGCKSNSCGCRKKSRHCGPGCECQGCVNLPVSEDPYDDSSDEENYSDLASNMDSDDSSDNRVDIEIITNEFLFNGPDIV